MPRSASVPEQLRDTNILQHDQHYRHLRTLWRLHQLRGAGKTLALHQVVARNLGLVEDYVRYVGRVGREALACIKLLERSTGGIRFAGRDVEWRRHDDEWQLRCGEATLVLVPGLRHDPMLHLADGATRVLVYLQPADGEDQASAFACSADSRSVHVSPSDFYGLEKLRLVIEAFLWRTALSAYGRPLGKLPVALSAVLQDKGWLGTVAGGGLGMLAPVAARDEEQFMACLQSGGLNAQTQARLRLDVDNLRALSSCRECGLRTRFQAGEGGFRSRCLGCATTMQLSTENGKRVALLAFDSDAAPSFRTMGARYIRMCLGSPIP